MLLFFYIKLCYLKNNCYICQRVSSTLRVGVRYNGSYLQRAIDAYPSTEIWTISTNGESSNRLTY